MCRARLLGDAPAVLAAGRSPRTRKTVLSGLKYEDFLTPETLARAADVGRDELERYRGEPVVRLRHL